MKEFIETDINILKETLRKISTDSSTDFAQALGISSVPSSLEDRLY